MRAGDDWQRISLLAGGDADNVLTVAQEDNGTLWLGTRGNGVFRVDCRELYPEARPFVNAIQFGEKHGLSTANEIKVFRVNDRIHVATQHGLRRFDPDRRRFVPDSSFGEVFADTTLRIGTIHQDRLDRLWIIAGKTRAEIHLGMPQANGAYVWQKYPFHRLRDVYFDTRIYSDTDGAVWFGLGENLVRYDPSVSGSCREDYEAIVRQVVAGPREEVIFGDDIEQRSIIPELSFKNNSLRFRYSAPSFEDLAAMRYQVRLEGFDNKWSNWTAEANKEYTHLPAGSYRFRVRARNGCGEVSREGDYPFRILPPWYWRWWAFALYVLIAGAGVLGIVKARVRHLEAKTRKLAAIVAERTDTVREQAEKLQELDRLKSRFFANLSHEFRTPLTLILGPLEDVIARVKDQAARQDLRVMERNADRLLRLINQLLDLSRLESGRMTLRAGRGDFIAFLKGIVMSFASLAEQKRITLQFEGEPAMADRLAAEMYFDHDKIEKVFYNLLSNACKFTREGGVVAVIVAISREQRESGRRGERESGRLGEREREHAISHSPLLPLSPSSEARFVEVTMKDTGIGIPADRLPYIFDRFYQVDSSHTREHEGTGIGLALTKELVERHYGNIEVRSEEGKGTEFIVRLPLGKEHLKPEEIVDESEQSSVVSDQLPVTGDRASEKWQLAGEMDTSIPLIQPSSTPSLQPSVTPSIPAPASGRNEVEIPMHRDDLPIILVVDDHPDVRSYIRKHLEPDFHVIEAKDGQEGVDIAREALPDLVISDVMMPKLDGYQLCEALKTNEKTSHIPVILLTAKAGEENKLAGLDTGADDYLIKPFSSRELQVRAKNLIALRRRLAEHFRREGLLQPHEIKVPSVEEAFLQKLMQVTEQHLGEEDFEIDVLRRELNMGQKQLYRKIKALAGQTPTEFIRTIRLRRAKQLLAQNAGTISEIAFQVGFNNLSYFSKCFRDEFEVLPSEVLKK
jgi:signal transduction histidine kinase/DNA-binding response OmpR family regulator